MKLLCSKRGLTLPELLCVLALIAIVLGIGVPHYLRSQERYKLKEQSTRVVEDLRYARELAVAGGGSKQVRFVSNGRTFSVNDGTADVRVHALPDTCEMTGFAFDFAGSGSIDSSTASPSPNSAGRIVLEVRYGQTSQAIEIEPTTGLPVN